MICLSRRSTASRKVRVLPRLTVILSLRRIRAPSARRDKLRILRLRSQARFAQDDTCTPRKFRVLHKLTVILSLRRIRDPSARGDEVRILRLRSQARFAQDDTALLIGFEPFEIQLLSYGQRSGLVARSCCADAG